ncbi:MAG: hypothetical protein WBD36_16345 [Bacteroidota bacterium]
MKAIFFDYWTLGIDNFLPLKEHLEKLQVDFRLVHLGSFRGQCPPTEVVAGIRCFDFRFYHTFFFLKILQQEKPDIVFSLNTTHFFDRVLVLGCRFLGIKTAFLMHGEHAYREEDKSSVTLTFTQKYLVRGRNVKFYLFALVNYCSILMRTGRFNPVNVLKVFTSYIFKPTASYYPLKADELHHDYCFVPSLYFREYYQSLGYKDVDAVGHFRLYRTKLAADGRNLRKEDLPERIRTVVESGTPYAVYIEDSFPETGMKGFTLAHRNETIRRLSEKCRSMGLRLVVKLHPTTIPETIVADDSVIVVHRADLDTVLYYCSFVFGTISTAIINAIILGKDVFILRWDKFLTLPPHYLNLNIATPMDSFEAPLNSRITDADRRRFLEEHVFPSGNPAEAIMNRIAPGLRWRKEDVPLTRNEKSVHSRL